MEKIEESLQKLNINEESNIEIKKKFNNNYDIQKIKEIKQTSKITGELIIQNLKCCIENEIFIHFQEEKYIKGLIILYQSSQTECSRSSGLTPEVGSSRERDLIASFASNPLLNVNYDITNEKEEDVKINNNNISIKHSSNKNNSQNGIKIIWTVDIEKRNEFLKKFTFNCDLIIIYVRFDKTIENGYLEIIYISRNELIHQQTNSSIRKEILFKCLEGNSRGIEFDKKFFEKIIQNSLFHIKINFKNFKCDNFNPISKRLKLLNLIY